MTFAFSDGNPLQELLVFFILVAAFLGLTRLQGVRARFEGALSRVVSFTRRRNALPENRLQGDLVIVDLARIFAGSLASYRFGQIFDATATSGDTTAVMLSGFALLLALMVLFGVLTPVAIFLLMATGNVVVDNYLSSSTLGTMVMSILLLALLLAPAGRTYAVDTWLAKRSALAAFYDRMFAFMGPLSSDRILIAKLCSLLAYWCLCLYSVSWHLHDEAWMSGLAISHILLSSVSNPYLYEQAWQVYQAVPWLFVNFGKFAIAGMIAWYILFLPGLFAGRLVKWFVIVWGLLFFLISTFVLPLRFLGPYELVYWFLLFAAGPAFGRRGAPDLAILFDDRCNLCDRTVKTLARLDLFGRLEFRPIRRNLDFAGKHGVTLEEGLIDLVGIEARTGKRLESYNLYSDIARRLIVLWPLAPVLLLGKLFGIGPRIYRWIAARRTKLFGVCEFSTIPDLYRGAVSPATGPNRERSGGWPAVVAGMSAVTVLLAALFLMRLPLLDTQGDKTWTGRFSKELFGSAPLAVGIGKINVFNAEDLAYFKFGLDMYMADTVTGLDDPRSGDALWRRLPLDVLQRTDRNIYGVIGHFRRAGRMNLGCDTAMWDAVVPQFDFSRSPRTYVILERIVHSWPTDRQLARYAPLKRTSETLCRVAIDARTGVIASYTFLQAGVDKVLAQNGYEPVIRADAAPAAYSYPCRVDTFFLSALQNAHGSDTAQTDERADAIVRLQKRLNTYGRFQIDCLMETRELVERYPDLLRTGPPGNANAWEICTLGRQLLDALPDVSGLDRPREEAALAEAEGRPKDCAQAAIAGRQHYMNRIFKSKVAYATGDDPS